MALYDWLLSLNVVFSRFFHVVFMISTSSLFFLNFKKGWSWSSLHWERRVLIGSPVFSRPRGKSLFISSYRQVKMLSYGFTTFRCSIHKLRDIWLVFSSLPLWIMLYQHSCREEFLRSFSLTLSIHRQENRGLERRWHAPQVTKLFEKHS